MKLHFSLAARRNGANPTHLYHTASTYNYNRIFFTKKELLKFRVTEEFWRPFQFLKNYQLIPKTEPMNHSNRIFNLTISSTSYQKLIHLKVFTSLFYNRLWFWCFTTWNGTVKIAYKKNRLLKSTLLVRYILQQTSTFEQRLAKQLWKCSES